ncbi:MAG: carbohydrate kinase family protein [Actinomycetota bacterium]
MERPDLIVVGDVMVDVAVAAPALVRGGDVHGDVRLRPGGSGANAAVWAAAAGARVTLYGKVGDDLAGRLLSQAVRERGVDARLTVDPDARTGSVLTVLEAGERSMAADRGANARLGPDDVPSTLEARAVLVSGYLMLHESSRPAAEAALARAGTEHIAVDAASWPLIRDMGAKRFLSAAEPANLLLANEEEARALSGGTPEEAARDLAGRFAWVVVKLGARGVLSARYGTVTEVPSPVVGESDATGAGDAFDGVLLARLALGDPPEEALGKAADAGAQVAAASDPWP